MPVRVGVSHPRLTVLGMPTPHRRPATRTPDTDRPPASDRLFGMLPPPGEIGAGLALLGLLAFVVCYSYERSFYATSPSAPTTSDRATR